MLFLELTVQGLVQGAIYAMIALGLTLVYGLLRILHVAHAALFTLGGYVGVIVTNETGSLEVARICPRIYVQDNGRRLVDGPAGQVMASAELRRAYPGGETA